jgi:hypothetical protein
MSRYGGFRSWFTPEFPMGSLACLLDYTAEPRVCPFWTLFASKANLRPRIQARACNASGDSSATPGAFRRIIRPPLTLQGLAS